MENLWPDNLENIEPMETPKAILDDQSKYLSKLTKDMLYAYIKEQDIDEYFSEFYRFNNYEQQEYDFYYEYNVKGKFLNEYSFTVFSIAHNIVPYPLSINIDEDILNELGVESYLDIEDQNQFKEILKRIFASKKMNNVIRAILSLSK